MPLKNEKAVASSTPARLDRRAARETATIGIFRSGETRRLSRTAGFEVAVVAVVDDPASAATRLTRRWHGAFSPREGWVLPFDSFDAQPWTVRFELLAVDERWFGPYELPPGLEVSEGMLSVDLPPGGCVRDFEAAFRAGMEELAFERVAARPALVDYRFRTRRPLVIGSRYSAPSRGWQLPPIADSIYAFRPKGIWWIVEHAVAARTLVGVRSALQQSPRHVPQRCPG